VGIPSKKNFVVFKKDLNFHFLNSNHDFPHIFNAW